MAFVKAKRKYVSRDVDRHGNVRWYFQKRGEQKVRLPGGPEHPHFASAYKSALDGESKSIKPRLVARRVTKQKTGYLYFLRVGNHIKIGHSLRPLHRLDMLSTGLPEKVTSFVFIGGTQIEERALHAILAGQRSSGEWFRHGPQLQQIMAHAAAYGCLPTDIASRVEKQNETFPPSTVMTFPTDL